jgi:hypothetical protein
MVNLVHPRTKPAMTAAFPETEWQASFLGFGSKLRL